MKVCVIGSGLAGLTAAIRLLEAGIQVTLVAKGPGGLQLGQGTVDVLGYAPQRVQTPLEVLDDLPDGHPLRALGAQTVRESVSWLGEQLGLEGSVDENLHLPTAVGAVRPTALAAPSLAGADVNTHTSFAVVGVQQLKDFQAALIAGNLNRTTFGDRQLRAEATSVDFPPRKGEQDPSPVHFAKALDDPVALKQFAKKVAGAAGDADVLLVPAVVGLDNPEAWAIFQDAGGRPAAEVSMQPPSMPGLRMFRVLLERARELGVRHIQGVPATGFEASDGHVTAVEVASAGHTKRVRCDAVVHAPGGFESGALTVDSKGTITERLFGLPLTANTMEGLVLADHSAPQPLFEVGVKVDEAMRPVGASGAIYDNLYAAGGILAGAQRAREKSGDGIAVASAWRAAASILGGSR